MNPLFKILTTDGGYDIYQLTISAVGLYFLPAPFTMQAMGKAWGAKKALEKEIKRWQRNLHAMDSIPENRNVSRKLKGVLILERWMSYGPWGRNRESASGLTFFSLEEGSNFVQNSRQHRTFFHYRRKSFLFAHHTASHIPPHPLRPEQTIKRKHNYNSNLKKILAVPATFLGGRKGKKQLTVVSAEQACNRKRFLPWFQLFPSERTSPGKLNSRHPHTPKMASCAGYCACRKGDVQVVSERLVSKAGAFYSLLAQELRGLDFGHVFLLGCWAYCCRLIVQFLILFSVTLLLYREQLRSWNKNHDGIPSMCDMKGRHLFQLWKVSFPHALHIKRLAA